MDRQSPRIELELWEDYLHKDKILKNKTKQSYLQLIHFLVIYGIVSREPSSFLGQIVKLVSWFFKKKYRFFSENNWIFSFEHEVKPSEIDFILPSVIYHNGLQNM